MSAGRAPLLPTDLPAVDALGLRLFVSLHCPERLGPGWHLDVLLLHGWVGSEDGLEKLVAPWPIRLLQASDELRGDPEWVAEAAAARAAGEVWALWDSGRPVAMASVGWRSSAHYDLAVEVARGARRRGYGLAVAAAAMLAESARDERAPVWACEASNDASLRAAVALGFEPRAAAWVAYPRRGEAVSSAT